MTRFFRINAVIATLIFVAHMLRALAYNRFDNLLDPYVMIVLKILTVDTILLFAGAVLVSACFTRSLKQSGPWVGSIVALVFFGGLVKMVAQAIVDKFASYADLVEPIGAIALLLVIGFSAFCAFLATGLLFHEKVKAASADKVLSDKIVPPLMAYFAVFVISRIAAESVLLANVKIMAIALNAVGIVFLWILAVHMDRLSRTIFASART